MLRIDHWWSVGYIFPAYKAVDGIYLAISDILDSSTQRLARFWKSGVISTLSEEAVERARSKEPR